MCWPGQPDISTEAQAGALLLCDAWPHPQLRAIACHYKAARSDCTFKAARISWAITHPAISRGSQACPEGFHTSSRGGSGPAAVTAVMAPLRARARRSMGRCLLSWTKATCATEYMLSWSSAQSLFPRTSDCCLVPEQPVLQTACCLGALQNACFLEPGQPVSRDADVANMMFLVQGKQLAACAAAGIDPTRASPGTDTYEEVRVFRW